mmetsp:Transcript_38805/g.93810  ORF Transcript_38805/g.93810 Transcript_38805/m.93810 type:complete len:235 (-) Transcript_38805:414-1118(-)
MPLETLVPRLVLFLLPRLSLSKACQSGTLMDLPPTKLQVTTLRSSFVPAVSSRTPSALALTELTTSLSCAIPTLLLESLWNPTTVPLPRRPLKARMRKKSGSEWNKNSPSSTWMSAPLLAGPRVACPAVNKVLTTALSVQRTPLDVPLSRPCTKPPFTPESKSLEPTERSCLDNKNTKSDHASELMLVTNLQCPDTSCNVSVKISKSTAHFTPSQLLKETGTVPVCTPTFPPSP